MARYVSVIIPLTSFVELNILWWGNISENGYTLHQFSHSNAHYHPLELPALPRWLSTCNVFRFGQKSLLPTISVVSHRLQYYRGILATAIYELSDLVRCPRRWDRDAPKSSNSLREQRVTFPEGIRTSICTPRLIILWVAFNSQAKLVVALFPRSLSP